MTGGGSGGVGPSTPCVVILLFIGDCCAFVGRLRHMDGKLAVQRIRPLFSPIPPPRPKVTGWLFREQMVGPVSSDPTTSSLTHTLSFPPPASISLCVCVQEREPGQQQQQPRQREDIFKVKRHKALWSALISLCVVFFFFHPSLYLFTSSSSSFPSRPTLYNPDRMASIRPGTPSTR